MLITHTCMHVCRHAYILTYLTLHYVTLHYTTLHYIPLHYTTVHYTTLHYTTLHYITLHYITLHYIALHCITLRYTTLHCYITLHTCTYTHTHIYIYIILSHQLLHLITSARSERLPATENDRVGSRLQGAWRSMLGRPGPGGENPNTIPINIVL